MSSKSFGLNFSLSGPRGAHLRTGWFCFEATKLIGGSTSRLSKNGFRSFYERLVEGNYLFAVFGFDDDLFRFDLENREGSIILEFATIVVFCSLISVRYLCPD